MPDPKDNAKLTGDTHLPDVESDLPVQGGTSDGAPQARPRNQEGRPGRGVRKAGVLTDGGEAAGGSEVDSDGPGDGGSAGDGGAAGDGGGGGGGGGGD